MLRYLGLLLLFSSAAMTGFYAAAVVDERQKTVERQLAFWQQFARQLSALHSAPGQIVALLAAGQEFACDSFFVRLWQAFDKTDSFAVALQSSIAATPALRDSQLRDILLPLCSVIGLRDIDSQLAMLDSVTIRLEQLLQATREQSRQKAGLYRRLGIFGGLLLAVIFF